MRGKKIISMITDILFPKRCPVCDRILATGETGAHPECMRRLKVLAPPYCMKCGSAIAGEEKLCKNCSEKDHAFKRGRCLYEYESAAPSIYRFKYAGRQEYASFFGEETAFYLKDFFEKIKADALVPIPIHRMRYAKRGYNQALVLAREISKHTGIPVLKKLLVRRRNTAPLKLLSPSQRQKNLKNAFIVRQNSVKLKTIILIDDIYTTGATMDEAARQLHRAGIPDVYFVALAGGKGL